MEKKLLIIMDSMAGGGAEKVLVELLRHLSPDDYRITLLLFNATGPHMDEIPPHVNTLHVYRGDKPLRDRLAFHTPWRDALMARRLKRMLGDARFDVALSFLEGAAAWLHSLLPRDIAPRHLSWVHIDFSTHHWSRAFFRSEAQEQAFYESMDRVVFVSHDARQHFTLPLDEARTSVIYNLIDEQDIRTRARELTLDKQGFTLAIVGRLHPIKRHDRFIEALALLRDERLDVNAWIVGDGDERQRLERLCRDKGLTDRVTFQGFQKNPYPFIAQADALVIASDAEGFPLVMLEALTLGTPVIATRCAGPAEALSHGGGLLTDFTPEALAAAIKTLHDNPEAVPTASRPPQFSTPHILAQITAILNS